MGVYTGTGSTVSVGQTSGVAAAVTHAVNAVNALGGALTAYTPTLTGFTPGNGTAVGRYMQTDHAVYFEASFTLGTTSAAASASPTLTLPVTAVTPSNGLASGLFTHTGFADYNAIGHFASTTSVALFIPGASGLLTTPTTTTPFTWVSTDVIRVSGWYWAA